MTTNQNLQSFQITQEKFNGPLDLLLTLIEERKLEIAEISIAKVTDDFLKHLGDIKQAQTGTLADFLVIAAKLLLIKSKSLLPSMELTQEEQEEIQDLTKRLEIYRLFKEISQNLKKMYEKNELFGREFLYSQTPIFYPPENLSANDIQQAFAKIWEEFQKINEETSVEKIKKIVKIEEKIKHILNLMNSNGPMGFNSVISKGEKIEIIITFLAILQMFKEKMISIDQDSEFGEIKLSVNNQNGGS